MKLITYLYKNEKKFGLVSENGVVDLTAKIPAKDLKNLIELNLLDRVKQFKNDQPDYKIEEIKLLPVIENPDKIFCAGVNYDDHRLETNRDVTANPTIFFRVAQSQIAHNDPMLIPIESDRLDFEGEIAIVISKEGRRIPEEDAYDYIAGYSIYNDGSVRDYQLHTSQWGPGKNFEATGAFGPWLVTKDEIADGEVLTLETRLNGQVMQKADTNLLLFSIPELIAYCSTFTTLKAGDVIVTGTPGGVGAKRKPPVFMKDGDKIEVEVSKIGILTNPVKQEI
ncbi:fumarylacetoacetate hydrolase family protein [Bacillus norwichensis]|uniref:Fumarylacetoacetate hydrolase family protein n=1 Tax=Bacillus norwichensis TaxID=2762217 RepID=A0ABR8VPX6_9BACI|nr:fumarylacetoacetate hydrolase family protein [Bacillus norwichensis]MBD8006818.1 fumarylacetoacetate hydrolase family protein [Bacillus norwichensis]